MKVGNLSAQKVVINSRLRWTQTFLCTVKMLIAILTKMVEAHNTKLEKFEYIDYEIIWQTPTVLGTVEDFLKINSELSETIA